MVDAADAIHSGTPVVVEKSAWPTEAEQSCCTLPGHGDSACVDYLEDRSGDGVHRYELTLIQLLPLPLERHSSYGGLSLFSAHTSVRIS